jgi:alpha-amylase/alpha-mannosidase (GH57 family)
VATHVAFLLHMHQPLYVDPERGQALMPWTRLHGARGYLDVARLLDEYGAVAMTINMVPSLVEQLEAVVGGARDTWLDVASRPTGAWTPEERRFLLERFFSVEWSRHVESRPRYRELLEKRGRRIEEVDLAARARTFSDGELRDLTVLFHLAWLGFTAREGNATVAALEAKGRDYSDGDLAAVVGVGLAACARVLPLYRKLAARGQVELSSSPYYHPIVPLLCDTDAARRAQHLLPLPDRFAFPGDARRQIALGRDAHARTFGAAPAGMWPPEGSISPEAVAAYHDEGIAWLASDEGNLWRSLPEGSSRGALYRPYRFEGVDLVFRDREISDRVGFSYAHGDGAAGAADLLARARAGGDAARAAGEGEPLVAVILDGENPWEAYPGSGEPFLRALFEALSRGDGGVRPSAIGHYLRDHPAPAPLARLHSGSWIDSDFHIWIGDPVKNRAWNLLGRARRRLERATAERHVDEAARERALGHLLAAEGSDWFWWFGEPFHTSEKALFDQLFRSHLAAASTALGEPPPEELFEPVASAGARPAVRPPRAFLCPTVDGRVGSYYEWIDAGRYEVPRGAAMAEAPLAAVLHFGFDARTLYLRVDPAEGARARLCAAEVALRLRAPARELALHARPGERSFTVVPPEDGAAAATVGSVGQLACADILEIAIPFAAVPARAGERLELELRLLDSGVTLGRYPRDGFLELVVPDAEFEAAHWL